MADPPADLAWQTLASRTAYATDDFEVRRDDVRLPDGAETRFEYVHEPESVVILPVTPDGEVVLVEEWRQAVDRVNRGLPAGGIEPGDDTPAAAARRELAEETGYAAAELTPLVTVEPSNGLADAVHHYFLAEGCTPDAERAPDADESIRPVTTDLEGLRDAVRAGSVRDGRTVLGVLYFDARSGEERPHAPEPDG